MRTVDVTSQLSFRRGRKEAFEICLDSRQDLIEKNEIPSNSSIDDPIGTYHGAT